jgi:hypothetical protein
MTADIVALGTVAILTILAFFAGFYDGVRKGVAGDAEGR